MSVYVILVWPVRMFRHNLYSVSSIKYHVLSMKKRQTGFTLIELLVVIAIISILATFLMANFIGIRQRGRDGNRKSNLYSLQSALELYRSDEGLYPFPALAACGQALSSAGGAVYMTKIPCDPLTKNSYTYASTDGVSYTLIACLENQDDSEKDSDALYELSGCSTPASFTLTNP